MFAPVDAETEGIASEVLDSAFRVRRALGPGLRERAYLVCLADDLRKTGLVLQEEMRVSVTFDGRQVPAAFRVDAAVGRPVRVLIELKAGQGISRAAVEQMVSYLRFTECRLGLIIDFHAPLLKDGIRRVVL